MKLIINIIISFSAIVVLAIAFSHKTLEFSYLIALPISVFLSTFLFRKKLNQYNNSIVLILFFLQLSIRYLILPLVMAYGDNLSVVGNVFYRDETIFYMVIELLMVYLAFAVFDNKYKISYNNRVKKYVLLYPNLKIFIILGLVLLYIISSGYFSQVNYIWQLQSYIENSNELENVSSLSGILFSPFRLITSLVAISYIYKKKFKKYITFILLFIIIFLNTIIIVGTSRFSIILSALPLITVIYLMFSSLRKPLVLFFIASISITISITTINKFTNSFYDNDMGFVNTNSLNAYFTGPGNVSKGIELYYSKEKWERLDFFISDNIQNVPLLSKLSHNKFKTNFYFNEAIYGHQMYQDQIVPLSLNGLIHFGIIGPFIYPFLFISLALFFERKFLLSANVGYKLVYISLTITLSLIFMLNIGALISAIFRNMIFLLIPIIVINITNQKK